MKVTKTLLVAVLLASIAAVAPPRPPATDASASTAARSGADKWNDFSCNANSGRWTYVKGWGWGCVFGAARTTIERTAEGEAFEFRDNTVGMAIPRKELPSRPVRSENVRGSTGQRSIFDRWGNLVFAEGGTGAQFPVPGDAGLTGTLPNAAGANTEQRNARERCLDKHAYWRPGTSGHWKGEWGCYTTK